MAIPHYWPIGFSFCKYHLLFLNKIIKNSSFVNTQFYKAFTSKAKRQTYHLATNLKKCYLFIYFIERERERMRARRVTGRERISNRLYAWFAVCAQSHDPEIMIWAEIKSQMLNQLSHPGTPALLLMPLFRYLNKMKNSSHFQASIRVASINQVQFKK